MDLLVQGKQAMQIHFQDPVKCGSSANEGDLPPPSQGLAEAASRLERCHGDGVWKFHVKAMLVMVRYGAGKILFSRDAG
jgi:hypothetical protein